MDERIKFFVGLDAHKDSISVSLCEAGREPARFVSTIGPDLRALLKVLGKYGDPAQVSLVYKQRKRESPVSFRRSMGCCYCLGHGAEPHQL